MRKLGWFAVSAAVVALVAFGVLLLAANLYVQSQGAQQKIRQTLTDALHVPVSLKKTTLTPWEGLRIDGIALHVPSSATPAQISDDGFMTVDSFRVRIAMWPLLTRRRVLIEGILLDRPRLAWAQNPEGRWIWPGETSLPVSRPRSAIHPSSPAPAALMPPSTPSVDPVISVPPPSQAQSAAAIPAADQTQPGLAAGSLEIPKFRVRHGWLDLLDGHRKLLGGLEEINLDGKLCSHGQAEGELHVQRAVLARPALRLTNFSSTFLFDEAGRLSIDGGRGEMAGGELETNGKLATQEPGSPFSAECHVNHVDLSALLKEAGSQLHMLDGQLQGAVHLEGLSGDPEHRTASGRLRLIQAQVRNFPVLQMLGDMLKIRDLSHLEFKTAELDCQLEGENVQIAPLNLVSNDLQILAEGRYFTGKDQIDLHGRLIIDPAIERQLPEFIKMNFTACGAEDPGCRYIEFDVTGPLGKPSTNLFDRVLAGPANGLLQNLLAPKPKKGRGKLPKPDGTAPATPSPGGRGDS